MNTIHHKDLSIYFGNQENSFTGDFLTSHAQAHLNEQDPRIIELHKVLNLERLFWLRQVHGKQGRVVTSNESFFQVPEGDFMVTQQKAFGLGVYTADCLPLVFYDPHHAAVGICHAGWAGSVKGVASETLKCMTKEFLSDPGQVQVFFGPSAQRCCYEVQKEFLITIEQYSFKKEVIEQRADKLFFDLPLFNKLLLQEEGVVEEAYTLNAICTICDYAYCSNRRSKGAKERNVSIVALKV